MLRNPPDQLVKCASEICSAKSIPEVNMNKYLCWQIAHGRQSEGPTDKQKVEVLADDGGYRANGNPEV